MSSVYTEKQRKDLERKEYNRLVGELKKHNRDAVMDSSGEYSFLLALFAELAFLSVTLSECKQLIQRDGIYEEYRNSATQYGRKKSVAVETYDRYAALYLKTLQAVEKTSPNGLALCDNSFMLRF